MGDEYNYYPDTASLSMGQLYGPPEQTSYPQNYEGLVNYLSSPEPSGGYDTSPWHPWYEGVADAGSSALNWATSPGGSNLLFGGLSQLGNWLAYQQNQEMKEKELKLMQQKQALSEKESDVTRYLEPWKVDLAANFMGRSNLDPTLLQSMSEAARKGYSQAYSPSKYVGNAFKDNPFGAPLQINHLASGGMPMMPEAHSMSPMGALGLLSGFTAGQDDKVDAALSDGEYVVPSDVVSDLGDGNSKAGGLALTRMVAQVRAHKGKPKKLPPKAKRPEQYLGK